MLTECAASRQVAENRRFFGQIVCEAVRGFAMYSARRIIVNP
jgi:hypothetical protein